MIAIGKYVLLVTLAGALSIGYLASQGQQTSLDTTKKEVEREEGVIARQIARSAFNAGVNELRRNFEGWREDTTGVEYEGGTYDLSASGPTGGPVELKAVGRFGEAAYRITAKAIVGVEGFDGLGVEGPLSSVRGSGNKYLVSGRDTDPAAQNETAEHGSGDGYDGHGMRLSDEKAYQDALDEFPEDQVVGAEGEGDIEHQSLEIDLGTLREEIQNSTTHTKEDIDDGVGTTDDPAIIAADGDVTLDGEDHGIGALYVGGNFVMRGNSQWEGIVLVENGDTSVDTEGDLFGDARVFGSLIHNSSGGSSLELAGNVRVQYSSEAIKVLEEILPTVRESTTFRIIERNGEMISSTR